MKSGVMNSSWISIHPARRMDAPYWLAIMEWMDQKGLPHEIKNVRMAITGIEEDAIATLAKAQEIRQRARALDAEASQLEDGIAPALRESQKRKFSKRSVVQAITRETWR